MSDQYTKISPAEALHEGVFLSRSPGQRQRGLAGAARRAQRQPRPAAPGTAGKDGGCGNGPSPGQKAACYGTDKPSDTRLRQKSKPLQCLKPSKPL